MGRNKNKFRHGGSTPRGTPAGGNARRGPLNASELAMNSFLAGARNGFSMQEEARNTSRDHLKWDRDEKLRYRPVTFVSAGFIEPSKDSRIVVALQPPSNRPSPSTDPVAASQPLDKGLAKPADPVPAPLPKLFYVDTSSDKTLRKDSQEKRGTAIDIRKPLSSGNHFDKEWDSDSSEEVILFKGRAQATRATASAVTAQEIGRGIKIVESQSYPIESPAERPDKNGKGPPSSTNASVALHALASSGVGVSIPARDVIKLVDHSRNGSHNGSQERCRARAVVSATATANANESRDVLADYIENINGLQELVSHQQRFLQRDLGGSEVESPVGDEDSDENRSGTEDSDSDDNENNDIDEALDSDGDALASGDRSASAVGEDEWQVDIDDKRLARLLAKQEALGLGGDELLLFDQAVSAPFRCPSSHNHKGQGPLGNDNYNAKSKANANTKPSVAVDSASAVARAFEDLDLDILMDWDRVNPGHRKAKGKHGEVKFGVEDTELQAAMAAAYEKDRLKKKERKKEREELRTKGMLGKNANPDDPRVKYPTGISLKELEEVFRTFLLGSDSTVPLPPMDTHARKVVHELASKLKIKSKSGGSGDQRRPVLHRTKSTVRYSEGILEQHMARIHRRFFARLDAPRDKQRNPGGGRSAFAALRYRDGEVVGASAPELAQTNKGRAMLERMGWTKGMGLGAEDNKGILEPVPHVVKVSKAGLG